MSTPPAKFCNVPLRAIPMATPALAKMAMNELVSMPSTPMTVIMSRNSSVILTNDSRNEINERSKSLRTIRARTTLYILLMMNLPM